MSAQKTRLFGRAQFCTALLYLTASIPASAQDAHRSAGDQEMLIKRIEQLERRLSEVEKELAVRSSSCPAPVPADSVAAASSKNEPLPAERSTGDPPLLPAGVTANAYLEGHYGYNFNRPVGSTNLLRAYDAMSNNFTLSQATLVLERAPDVEAGQRAGGRLDLQFGQATETLQGSESNEPRPRIYRNIFQAYGSYVFPLGSGLRTDFGKFASALGYEGNYAKDQINYSRSYWFNFLPFYHMGFRTTYSLGEKAAIANWVVNGGNQTEDFNGFKSTAFLLTLTPTKNFSWNLNYYTGREQRETLRGLGGRTGVPEERMQVFDSYASWNVTDRLLLVGEVDYVRNAVSGDGRLGNASGGAAYARYQFTPEFSLGGRFAYLRDRNGIFSGVDQVLRDSTVTAAYNLADGIQAKLEYRRDASNRPFFLRGTVGSLKKEQNTVTLGLMWWFGGKQGSW